MDKAIKLGHEPSAISVKGVLWFLVILVLTLAATYAAVWGIYGILVRMHEESDLPRSSLASIKTVPPEPRIQPTKDLHERTEHEDLDLMHAREDQRFAAMGWVNSDGDVKIPESVANTIVQMSSNKTAAPAAAAAPTTAPVGAGAGQTR